jgi:hypothetical protein
MNPALDLLRLSRCSADDPTFALSAYPAYGLHGERNRQFPNVVTRNSHRIR